MKKFDDYVNDVARQFGSEFHDMRTVNVFCRMLYLFLILKIVASWPTWSLMIKYDPPRLNDSFLSAILFFPARVAIHDLSLFCWFTLLVTVLALFIRRNYFTAALILWMAINAHKINFAAMNGADLVFLMMMGFGVLMCQSPEAKKPVWKSAQRLTFNFSVLVCRAQIMLIYFFSGLDKFRSSSWRSGEAIYYISKADHFFNPGMTWVESLGSGSAIWLSWIVILFELTFPFLVWIRATRLYVLAVGIVFHIVIWVFLSLPDFGFVMIISYLIFLRDGDLKFEGFKHIAHIGRKIGT